MGEVEFQTVISPSALGSSLPVSCTPTHQNDTDSRRTMQNYSLTKHKRWRLALNSQHSWSLLLWILSRADLFLLWILSKADLSCSEFSAEGTFAGFGVSRNSTVAGSEYSAEMTLTCTSAVPAPKWDSVAKKSAACITRINESQSGVLYRSWLCI